MSEAYTLMHIPMRLVETVRGIASGSLVAVPREPTPRMQEDGARSIACHSAPNGAQQWEALACYRAMLAASEAPK